MSIIVFHGEEKKSRIVDFLYDIGDEVVDAFGNAWRVHALMFSGGREKYVLKNGKRFQVVNEQLIVTEAADWVRRVAFEFDIDTFLMAGSNERYLVSCLIYDKYGKRYVLIDRDWKKHIMDGGSVRCLIS